MTIFLSIQHTYQGIEIALFNDAHCIATVKDDKKHASKNIIMLLDNLLRDHGLTIHDIKFFGVNQGPGPFTTLRVVIASVNGLGFATKKPLIGIDGLDALVEEYRQPTFPITLALLNAFSQDVYFAIDDQHNLVREKGCKNITTLLLELKERFKDQIFYGIGNGVSLYEHEIRTILGDRIICANPMPSECSVTQIGRKGYEFWQQGGSFSHQILPLYLKNMMLSKT